MDPAGQPDPIKGLAVLSTGSVKIRPEHGRRTRRPLPVWLLSSREWTAPLPINVYVIRHERGLVLFDTGQDRRSVTDPTYYPGGLAGVVYHRLAEFAIEPDQSLPVLLAAQGLAAEDVTTAIVSHLHQDHLGGVLDLPNAQLLVTKTEWEAAQQRGAEANGFLKEHILAASPRWRQYAFGPSDDLDLAPFTSCYDVFGDGSLTLLPTPGHTPGSASLLIRRPRAPAILLVGDLTFDAPNFGADHLPGIGSLASLRLSTMLVKSLGRRHPGMAICATHDPAAAALFLAAAG